MATANRKETYVNAKQLEFLQAKQSMKVGMMGRGAGKTAVIGFDTRDKLSYIPRAKGFFSSTTYNQILTKTLPEVEKMWHALGLKEHEGHKNPGHYVVGRQPPSHFAKPYGPPKKFQNVITFFNGFTIEFLSTDRIDLARGGSYDFGYIDEAALIPKDKFTKVLLPTIRGNTHRFSHWSHGQVSLLTSVPWKATGQWILDYEDKAQEFPGEYAWIEGTAFDNIKVLGEKGIQRLRREMTEMEFRMEVMNERHVKIPDGFYHALDTERHAYLPQWIYEEGARGVQTTGMTKEYQPTKPMDLSFDFGGWFTGFTIWQSERKARRTIERCLDLMYMKDEVDLSKLVDRFCMKYKSHAMKVVNVYGEPRGHDRTATGPTAFDQIRKRFEHNGWHVIMKVAPGYQTLDHAFRNEFMNELLKESNPHWPAIRINQDDAKDLLFAMQITPITRDWKKDKSKEKVREFPQEHAPHLTDTFDYIFTQKYRHLFDDTFETFGSSAGVI